MIVNQNTKSLLFISVIFIILAIIIGAFGAHLLKPYLDEHGINLYDTASRYQFYNTLGLFMIAFVSVLIPDTSKIKIAYYFVLSGMIIFSTSLYSLAILKIMWLGIITPIGGVLMIIGWVLLALAIYQNMKK